MENHYSIEEIADKISANFNDRGGFEKYKLLLQDSGIKKEDISDFFVYPEGEQFEAGLSLHTLREKLRDDDFFLKFTNNILELLDNDSKQVLSYVLKKDGYFLDENNVLDKIAFKVAYNPIDHVVTVNDLVVSRPDFSSSNDNVIDYLANHPNKAVKIENEVMICEDDSRIPMNKTASKVINQLGFKNLAARIFFPGVSRQMIQFRNPITLSELRKRGYAENLALKDLFPDKINDTEGQPMTS